MVKLMTKNYSEKDKETRGGDWRIWENIDLFVGLIYTFQIFRYLTYYEIHVLDIEYYLKTLWIKMALQEIFLCESGLLLN